MRVLFLSQGVWEHSGEDVSFRESESIDPSPINRDVAHSSLSFLTTTRVRSQWCSITFRSARLFISIMEKVNGNIEKRLPEAEEIWTGIVTMEEPRKETINRSVNPGQVLPLMQVSLRNSKLASSLANHAGSRIVPTTLSLWCAIRTRDFEPMRWVSLTQGKRT